MSQLFEHFGKYILLEKLASGGMAEVFLAKSHGANGVSKFLAIKRILPQYSDNPDFIEMFKEEAKIAVNLNHGNVVAIYDFGMEKNQFYLVMEYVEGRNLRQVINELKRRSISFTTEQIVYMIKEVAAGLDHAHRCIDGSTGRPLNITHRDISPQNIMVSFEGEVKVIDFGIAKAETQMEATKAGTLKGKFGYMSPEQSEGQPIDLRTDVFSLGIVLWELLTSDRLFLANSEAAILRKIRDCQIPSIRKVNPSIPIELEKIALKALAKDKSLRYQTAGQMHKDLNRFLNTEYPDFSPQDFSIFVKNNFSEIYGESKRKLVDYAKVQAISEERSSVTQTMTLIALENTKSPTSGGSNSLIVRDPSSSLITKTKTQGASNRMGIPSSSNLPEPGSLTARRDSSKSGGQSISNTFSSASPYVNPNSFPDDPDLSKKKDFLSEQLTSTLGMATIAGLLIVSGYLFLKPKSSPVTIPPKDSGVLTNPSKNPTGPPLYSVMIQSEPSGAQITIDGKETRETTPAQLILPAGKKFSLRLDKTGYFPHESDFTPKRDGSSVNITLLQGRSGYLTLDVINGGADPIIEINGQRINDRLPLSQYRIPANIPVRIRVYNPYSQVTAEKTVMVKENERASLHLILTREASRQ